MATLLRHFQLDTAKLEPDRRPRRVAEHTDRNRMAMIEKARTIWIGGFLEKSPFHDVRIVVGLNERPQAVARPMDLLVQRPNDGERPLPAAPRSQTFSTQWTGHF